MTSRPTDPNMAIHQRRLTAWLLAGVATASLLASPALAQTARPAAAAKPAATATTAAGEPMSDEDYEVEALIVEATKQPGAVVGDIPAENQFRPADIRAYGVSTVSELVDALAPQTTSGQGRDAGGPPVILINGARVSSFTEIRDLPTEAILRVDILPEEVALKYGYAAEQRVMNFVLRPFFRARVGEGGYRTSFKQGGGDVADLHASEAQITQQNRLLLDAKINYTNQLLESQRSFAEPRSDAAFRTLTGERTDGSVNFVLSRPLGNGVSGSINAQFEANGSTGLLGVDPIAPRALVRNSNTLTGHLGGSAAGAVKGWRWTATANLDTSQNDSTTQRSVAGAGYTDASNSVSTIGQAQMLVNGNLFRAPAGQVSTTITGGVQTQRFDSDFVRLGVPGQGSIQRDTVSGRVNLDIPIASRGQGVLEALGNLSLNFNVAIDDLSDFGVQKTVGAGINWAPITNLRLLASWTDDEGAPSAQQLGNPVQVTPGLQAYDFRTGTTATISQISGGNPNLKGDDRHVYKLSLNYKPFTKTDLNIQANYILTRTDDLISSFPTGSTQIENAFPDRFIRNAQGQLTQIDSRPVNFDRRDTEQLRYGFTYRRPFGPQPPQRGQGGFRPGGQGAPGQGFQRPGQGGQAGQNGQGQGGQRQAQAGQGQGQGAGAAQGGSPQGAPDGAPVGAPDGGPPPGAGFGGPPAGGPPPGGFGGPPPGGGGGFRGPPGGGFGGPPGGGFGGGGNGPAVGGPTGFSGPGTFQFGIYHTVFFKDEVRIRAGLPTLDLLDGASLGSGAGTARNQVDFQSNVSKGAYGIALSARWKEGSTIRGTGAAGSQDLIFSDLTTVGVRLFADLRSTPGFKQYAFFRGARLTLAVDNLFNEIQDVHDASGNVPIVYQPNYLDPQGRTYSLRFRKVF